MARFQIACFVSLITLVAALNARGTQKIVKDNQNLVFMHVPYNFGHTVEFTRAFPTWMLNPVFAGIKDGVHGSASDSDDVNLDPIDSLARSPVLPAAHMVKANAESWGHLDKALLVTSNVTGCAMYFTPQKYWPEHLAKKYFKHNNVFGLLRDPYERLIAMFRGAIKGYGASASKFIETCDVNVLNGAIQEMMKQVTESKDPFVNSCTYIPQAEYFEGPYGITVPVDNRRFPQSMNEVFEKYGYPDRISGQNIFHVNGCNNVWAGNLTAKTKQLVKKVYARDFELLCKHFGYCDQDENTCIKGVYHMCPDELFRWDEDSMQYIQKQ